MGAPGRHFLQIPGPTNVPDRVLRAMDMPTIDHRGPAFAEVGKQALDGMRSIFRTEGTVVIYPGSGTGAWEAALVNTLSPGDLVLMYETGHFSTLWNKLAGRLGIRTLHQPLRTRSRNAFVPIPPMRSRPSASFTTKPRPAASVRLRRCARQSMPPGIPLS